MSQLASFDSADVVSFIVVTTEQDDFSDGLVLNPGLLLAKGGSALHLDWFVGEFVVCDLEESLVKVFLAALFFLISGSDVTLVNIEHFSVNCV
jgi:hypothetical protein